MVELWVMDEVDGDKGLTDLVLVGLVPNLTDLDLEATNPLSLLR